MKKVLAAALFFTIAVPLLAGVYKTIRLQRVSLEHGLSQNSVTAIIQDKMGFLWFGSQDGLNRFDGYKFVVYRHNPHDDSSLSSIFITSLFEDTHGVLWVGTADGLNRYNRDFDNFERFYPGGNPDTQPGSYYVNSIAEDNSGILWIATNQGLYGLNRERTVARLCRVYSGGGAVLTGLGITELHKDRKGNLWVGTERGLARYAGKGDRCNMVPFEASSSQQPVSRRINAVMDDRTGQVWIGTGDGLFHFDDSSRKLKRKPVKILNPEIAENVIPIVRTLFEDQNGILWLGTENHGVGRICPQRKTVMYYSHDESDPFSTSFNTVISIFQDRSGEIWIGTAGRGVNHFNLRAEMFSHLKKNPAENTGLSSNFVWSVYKDPNGRLWIGTDNGGLNLVDRSKKSVSYFQSLSGERNSISSNRIRVIMPSRKNQHLLWLGTSAGLNKFFIDTHRTEVYRHIQEDNASLSDNRIGALYEDLDGYIWVGTRGGGLNRFDPIQGKIRRYPYSAGEETLAGNIVTAIQPSRFPKNVLWVGTWNGGLNRFDKRSGKVQRFQNNPANRNSLSNDNVLTLFISPSRPEILWIGTQGGGLNRYDCETGRFTFYDEDNGLPNNVVYGILEDEQGFFWISTNKGLSKFNPQDDRFWNFDVSDGLQSNEFNLGAHYRAEDGEMFFGGINGLTAFHPKSIKKNPFVPQVVITDFQIHRKTVPTKANRQRAVRPSTKPRKDITQMQKITLSHWENSFSFEFSAMSFTNPEKNKYKYIMEGFDENWIKAGNKRYVTYTNLDPGEYVFKVMGANNHGVWNPKHVKLAITIRPSVWKTGWAYAVYTLLVLLSLYSIRRFELKRRQGISRIKESEWRAQAAEAQARAIEAENARKTTELDEARKLQLSMLPTQVPRIPHMDIAFYMNTATEVGGDYYDFIKDEYQSILAFGDATGHGLKAGIMVAVIKGLFCADASQLGIKEFFNKCTDTIKKMNMKNLFMGMTILKFRGNEVALSAAGMPPIYLYHRDEKKLEKLIFRVPPLGALPNHKYEIKRYRMNPGDLILLLSDGLPELFNDKEEMFGYERLEKTFLESRDDEPDEIIKKLVAAGEKWRSAIPQGDDISMAVIRFTDSHR